MFVQMSVGFTCYLLALFIAWFSVLAIEDSALYYPWLNGCVEEILEIIFVLWVLITFRALVNLIRWHYRPGICAVGRGPRVPG